MNPPIDNSPPLPIDESDDAVEVMVTLLHAECEAEWDRRAAAGSVAITMHGPDAHRRIARERIDALAALGWTLVRTGGHR